MLYSLLRTLNDEPLHCGIRITPTHVAGSRQFDTAQPAATPGNRRRKATNCCPTRCARTSLPVADSFTQIQTLPLHLNQTKNTGIQVDAASPHSLHSPHHAAQMQHLNPPQRPPTSPTLTETSTESAAVTPLQSPADPPSASSADPHAPVYDSETQKDHETNGSAAVIQPPHPHPESQHHS